MRGRYFWFISLAALWMLHPAPALPWGSLYPGETHQYIISTAYNRLKADPAFATHLFPTFSVIKGHEGVQWTATGLFGVGPDGAGMSRYSEHYYNPVTGEGGGPTSSAHYFAYLVRGNLAPKSTNSEANGKAAAWSAHYLADMFVPYHVTGASRQIAERIWKEQSEKHPGVINLGFAVTGSSTLSYAAPFKEGNINFNTELSRFVTLTDPGEADWFDPWYYNGNTDTGMIKTSSHVAWEAFPNYSLKRGVWEGLTNPGITGVAPAIIVGAVGESFVEYHRRVGQGLSGYNSTWKNAAPSVTNPNPWDGQAAQVRELAVLSATETRGQLENYFADPTPALAKAIQAVYSMWRGSFSALRPTIEFQPDGPNVYKVIGKISNYANTRASSLNARLTTRDCTLSGQGEKPLGTVEARTTVTSLPWRVETTDKLCHLKLEVAASFPIPDLQYAVEERLFFPQQTTQPVKPKPAVPPPQSARPPAGGPGPVKGSFSIAQIYVNPRFGDRGVVVSGDLSSDYQGTGGGSASGSFPGELFNGLQISAYSVSGAALDAPQDSTGFTHNRRYKGRITGKTLTVSGSTTELYGKCNTEYGSFKFILEVKVSVNGVTKEYRSPEPCAKPAGTPKYEVKQGAGAFSVTVTAP